MTLKKCLPLLIIAACLFVVIYFHLYQYLSFRSLKQNHHLLLQWKDQHYLIAALAFMALYSLAASLAFPGTLFLSMAGGFMFGLFPGVFYVLFSATLGSTLLYLAIRYSLAEWFETLGGKWVHQLEQGLKQNAFNYLLAVRLIPIVPFWIINIVCGLLDLPLKTFVSATFIGMIPSTLIYTSIGKNLGNILETENSPHLSLLFQAHFLLPLICLAFLALLPVAYHHINRRH